MILLGGGSSVTGLPACALLALSGAPALSRASFILVKAVFAALEAALITPFLVLAALRDCRAAFPGATASAG